MWREGGRERKKEGDREGGRREKERETEREGEIMYVHVCLGLGGGYVCWGA